MLLAPCGIFTKLKSGVLRCIGQAGRTDESFEFLSVASDMTVIRLRVEYSHLILFAVDCAIAHVGVRMAECDVLCIVRLLRPVQYSVTRWTT